MIRLAVLVLMFGTLLGGCVGPGFRDGGHRGAAVVVATIIITTGASGELVCEEDSGSAAVRGAS